MTTRRVWLLVNIAITVALVPALFTATEHGTRRPIAVNTGPTVPVVATAAPGSDAVVVLGPTDVVAESTTTTTARPRPTPTTVVRHTVVTSKPRVVATRTTPTTAKPAPKAAPKPASTGNSETGKGTWYDHQPGICAHKTLPFGTVVTVTNLANGHSVTCTVGDRGPFVDGYVIDLNPREFDQLAPQSAGVINVRLTW